MNKKGTLISTDASQLNQLSCLKPFCQIQLICVALRMDKTENIESPTQCVDNFHRILNMIESVFLMVIGLSLVHFGL